MTAPDLAVLRFGGRRVPRGLRGLAPVDLDGITGLRRVVVLGSDADLATVLTRLLRAERLDVEVAHVTRGWGARRALTGSATLVPLIRDDVGRALVGAALWVGEAGALHGEAVVDDTTLFVGSVPAVCIEPTVTMPGLRAAVASGGLRPRRWVTGRAAQLGSTGAFVVRDGERGERVVRRSTFYRHTTGWLAVR